MLGFYPKESAPPRSLSIEDEAYNQRLLSARVIRENFYGRMKDLFKICCDRFSDKRRYF
jgi:hypothetical protein